MDWILHYDIKTYLYLFLLLNTHNCNLILTPKLSVSTIFPVGKLLFYTSVLILFYSQSDYYIAQHVIRFLFECEKFVIK